MAKTSNRVRFTDQFEHSGDEARGIAVERSVGYGDKGAFIEVERYDDDERALRTIAGIVGFEIRNVSESVTFQIPVRRWYRQESDGELAARSETVTFVPGAKMMIEKLDLYAWLLQTPSLGWTLANGLMKESCKRVKKAETIYEKAESFYFSYARNSGKRLHDTNRKFNCGYQDAAGEWHVKPEYFELFGCYEKRRIRRRSRSCMPLDILNCIREQMNAESGVQ